MEPRALKPRRQLNETQRAKARARAAAWREKNPEQKKAADAARYQATRGDRLALAATPEARAKKAARMRAARTADPEGHRLKFRAWNYGLSVAELATILEAGCAICGSGESLHIDHDHACCPNGVSPRSCGRCVRGALCHSCNTALGLLGENVGRVEAMAAFIRSRS